MWRLFLRLLRLLAETPNLGTRLVPGRLENEGGRRRPAQNHRISSSFDVGTIIAVRIEFDPAKNAGNIAKHGLPLSLALELNWDEALVWQDTRQEYGEMRMVALAPLALVVCFVAYVDRGNVRRIISLRRANSREVKRYEQG